ncbi:MAG TPA: enoyl-CoA hydratase/isomerase family protein, partial [Thermoanaerobaculia bacterium]
MKFVRLEDRGGVAVATLDRPPANALNADLFDELAQVFRESESASAIVLTSALPTIFSAGWDLPTVLELDRSGMEEFLDRFCNLIRQIFTFGAPAVVALPGHAIAGGMILASAGDERFASPGKGQLGLSEVLLGATVPECCLEVFRHVIGFRKMERLASTGENLSVETAREIGFLDRVTGPEDLLDQAVARARFLAERPGPIYAAIKRRARAAAVARFDQARKGDPFLDYWFA